MQSEEVVPIEQRYLLLEGILLPEVEQFATSITENRPKNSFLCFVSFTYADLPLPKEFDVVFIKGNPNQAEVISSRVIKVTQQFNKPFEEIPHGWKTICLIEFPNGIPLFIDNLPLIDTWTYTPLLCLSTLETWQAILKKDL